MVSFSAFYATFKTLFFISLGMLGPSGNRFFADVIYPYLQILNAPDFIAVSILDPLAKNWRINGQYILTGNTWLAANFFLGFFPSLIYRLILYFLEKIGYPNS